ncbi:MAG: protein-L-isoaspartate(D-aspartate) O-methyltransferase [Nitrospirota bacterium]|nr:protein-L-isoaspartate(D-aspartate) O-methyltransferase [Nitrospirota bacterium]
MPVRSRYFTFLFILTVLGWYTCLPCSLSDAEMNVPRHSTERQAERDHMVREQILARGVSDPAVIHAMKIVPRHKYVPIEDSRDAYEDHPLPIGFGQTISQPYIVAFMTEALQLQPQETVLEIGTGSGYQAAILAQLVKHLWTIEIVPELAERATLTFEALGINNITVRSGDGYEGWIDHAPFDAVILTAAPDHVPQPLLDQLKEGGRLISPIGTFPQELIMMTKTHHGFEQQALMPVSFVPMTGTAQRANTD